MDETTLIAQGEDLSTIGSVEQFFNENDYGEMRVYVDHTISEQEIVDIEQSILSQEVVLTTPIIQDSNILIIKFQKKIAPLIIIAGVLVAAVGGILGWQVFQATKYGIPVWAWGLLGLGVIMIFFSSDTGKSVTKAGTQLAISRIRLNPRRRYG